MILNVGYRLNTSPTTANLTARTPHTVTWLVYHQLLQSSHKVTLLRQHFASHSHLQGLHGSNAMEQA